LTLKLAMSRAFRGVAHRRDHQCASVCICGSVALKPKSHGRRLAWHRRQPRWNHRCTQIHADAAVARKHAGSSSGKSNATASFAVKLAPLGSSRSKTTRNEAAVSSSWRIGIIAGDSQRTRTSGAAAADYNPWSASGHEYRCGPSSPVRSCRATARPCPRQERPPAHW
jgi:hypothetical protein